MFVVGDKLARDVQNWLSPADPWKIYSVACELLYKGPETTEWFIRGNTFSEWKVFSPASHLWIHGKRPLLPSPLSFAGTNRSSSHSGLRKGSPLVCRAFDISVLGTYHVASSAIIQDIDAMRKAGLASLAIFYFDWKDDRKKDVQGLLSSLLVQLGNQSDSYHNVLSRFYEKRYNDVRYPNNDELVGCFKDLLRVPGTAPVYLILDALDECSNTSALPSPRDEVLKFLKELVNSQFPHLRICVTSRLEADIQAVFASLAFRSISLHNKVDIDNYIKSFVNNDPMMENWKVDDKERAIKVLMEKADGR